MKTSAASLTDQRVGFCADDGVFWVVGVERAVTVRSFEKRDLPTILRIEQESFVSDAWSRDVFLEYAAAAATLFLVARVSGKIAGYIIVCRTRHGAEIASLAVGPRYRQEGVATELLKTILNRLRRSGARAVWLMVRRENHAIRLYRKFGFVRSCTVPNYYDDHAAGWRMRLSLDNRRSAPPSKANTLPVIPVWSGQSLPQISAKMKTARK